MSDPKIKVYEDKMNKAIEFLEADLQTVRAGRANPHILDHVRVDYYGAPTPLQQVANVSVPEARIIQIQLGKLLFKESEKRLTLIRKNC